jgi:predicted membrane-bound spermidine synthase
LTWRNVQSLDIYDWDEGIVQLFQTEFREWNRDSLLSQKTKIYHRDVLTISDRKYDVIIVDLVDPNYKNPSSRDLWGKLIAKLPSMMHPTTSVVINGGGFFPWDTKNIEWQLFLISNTFHENETHCFQTYKVYVPSFDKEWCLFLIKPIHKEVDMETMELDLRVRYVGIAAWTLATTWARDITHLLPIQPAKLKGYLPPL